jgi:arsenate reductase-like glutaredoxin family protein
VHYNIKVQFTKVVQKPFCLSTLLALMEQDGMTLRRTLLDPGGTSREGASEI